MVVLLLNGSRVRTFVAASTEEMREHAKSMSLLEERFYKIGNELYHIDGRNLVSRKLKMESRNGTERFDDILPPD